MIGSSKINRENYPRKCFWTQGKETRVKFKPGLSANRPLNNWALEKKILTEPQTEKAKLLCCIRRVKLFYLVLDGGSMNIWKRVFSSLWDTWRIKFSQSHSLKRLSCSVASGRPNCFTLLVLDGGSKNIWKRVFKFPLRHLENKILAEPQPKKAKLLCCFRKAKIFSHSARRGFKQYLKAFF